MLSWILHLLFPPRCTLCRDFLASNETDFCHRCRLDAPEFIKSKRNIPFVAQWTAIWYYKDDVRGSIHRFKFRNARRYAEPYGRMLASRILRDRLDEVDLISWVPVSQLRRFLRGYDQGQLLAVALGNELHRAPQQVLYKKRHTKPQSSISGAPQRRANILGAYRICCPEQIRGKRILLLDDVVTTGSTASECAKTLMTAGAKEVYFAAVAAAHQDKK